MPIFLDTPGSCFRLINCAILRNVHLWLMVCEFIENMFGVFCKANYYITEFPVFNHSLLFLL